MLGTLLRKEFRSMAPFLGLVLFLIAADVAFTLFMEFPDQHSLSELLEHDTAEQVLIFVLAFALAAGLLVPENDEGTLAFLDSLPVNRASIFFCKVVPALSVLWLIPLSDLVLKSLFHSLSRTSIETHSPGGLFLTGSLLNAASCLVWFFLCLMLSFLRRFSYLVLGLLFCAYLFLQELKVPFVPLFNLMALGDPVYHGRFWLLPTRMLWTQLLLAAACASVSFGLFLMMGDTSQRLADGIKRRRGAAVLTGVATALAVAIWIGLAIYLMEKDEPNRPGQVIYQPWPIVRANTSHYGFIYRENQADLVNELLQVADSTEERVRRFLNAERISRIEADLTGSVPQKAGVAHWKTVQIDLTSAGRNIEELAAVLSHETAHVYIDHESRSRLDDDFNSTRFFHEGLATFVEYHLSRPPGTLPYIRIVGAVMRARDQVKFEQLLDNKALTQELDTDLVYPLGEAFMAALVEQYGYASPARIVRAFNRPNAPKSIKSFALWQDVFQSCEYNLGAVEERFFQILDSAVAGNRAYIDSVPRLRGVARVVAGKIYLSASFAGQSPGTMVCRFRPYSDSPVRLYEYALPLQNNTFCVRQSGYPNRSFWYQLGWQLPGVSQPIWEPWIETIIER